MSNVYDAIMWGSFDRRGKLLHSSERITKLSESTKKEVEKVAESISSVSTGAIKEKLWVDEIKDRRECSTNHTRQVKEIGKCKLSFLCYL